MNTTSPIRNFTSLGTPRAVVCLLFCWLGLILNTVALPPPVITAQPTNQTLQVGSNATFVVVATSGTPLTHQWHFQNARIPGATNSSYTRTNAQLTHAGSYYVALTNADGWAISTNAILTVGNYPGLNGHWKFDANANDFSGNNYNGTLTNGAAIDTNSATLNIGLGKVSLDGVNDYVDLSAHRGSFAALSQGTISAWIKTTDTYGVIFDVSDLAVANTYASLWLYQGALEFSVGITPQTVLDVATTAAVNDNAWHHVAVTVDATGNKLYIDGVQQTSLSYYKGNASTQKFFNDVPGIDFMAIGADRNSSGLRALFAGLIDDVRVHYGALTAADIAILSAVSPDVATTKSGPANVLATTNFSYTITVANLGNSTASNLVVSDTLPAGIAVVSVSGGGTIIGGGPGQVVFDRASSNDSNGNLTWTHVTTNAANRLMLVGVSFGNGGATSNSAVTALTYGGSNLTKVMALTNDIISSELWQLVNPPSGTNTVTITRVGAPSTLVAGAATFSGVDQATPLSAVNSAVSPQSKSVTNTITSATNEIVFDNLVSEKDVRPTTAPGQTRLWSLNDNESGGASIKPGTNSVTLNWTVKDGAWVDIAASVKAAGLIGVVSWTIPSLASGATTNFTITVTAPLGGTLSNNVSSTAATIDSNSTNNNGSAAAAQVVTAVVPIADIVTVQSGPTVVAPLTNYTYTVTVSNQGPCKASNVVVSEMLSPMLTFVSASAGGTYLAGVVTWPAVASLASGATTNFTVTVRAPLSGLLTNTASSTSATIDTNTTNNNGSAPAAQVVTVVSPLQTANTSKGASVSTLNWSHTVSPGSARILVVGVSIDASNSTINSATYANILPLTLLGQTNGTQSKVAIYYLINPPVGTYPVSINLSTASGIVGGAVSFNGVSQANPIAGFRANTGTSSNASVTVASTLGGVVVDTVAPKSPQYATNSGPAQNLEWNLSALNYSGAGSTMPGSASVSPSYTLDSPAAWAMAAVALNPATVLADITVSATGPASVLATSNLTYVITVTNLGNSSATNVVVSDVLPAGATFVSASSGGTFSGGVVTWPTLANFINGARTNYTVTIAAPANGSLTNIVYATAFTADPDPSNNNGAGPNNQVVTSVTPLADIATTVTGPASVFPAADYSYVVVVTNRGPSTASDVLISDTLPAAVLFVSASGGGANNAGVINWSIPSLNSGAATNFTVTVTAPNSGTLTNSILSTALSSDPNTANNDGSAPAARVVTSITPVADVATTVSGPTDVFAAANFSYLVVVTNQGPSTASSVVVSNTLPATVLFVSASSSGSNNGGVVSWSIPSLDSSAMTNFTVTVTAPANGSLTNIVASTSGTTDLVPSNNDGSAPAAQVITSITPVADIATTVAGPAIAITNAPFSYTVTVTNLGPSGATSVAVNDTLPAGATFLSASGGGTHNGGVVTWSLPSLPSGTATNFTVTVNAALVGRLTNTVASSALTGDPDLSNNDGSAVTARVVTGVYPLLFLTGQRLSGANFQIDFHTHPNTIVSIQATTNFVNWVTLITTNSGDGHVIFIDPDATNYSVRFYRSLQGP